MQTAKASTPFNSQGSIVGPPDVANMAFYVYKSIAESAVLIGLIVLSFE
jgi:hypothetical protein